ncbi:hypothetical protein CYMTET_45076, partial [Cymbomonas tetramitiformis]
PDRDARVEIDKWNYEHSDRVERLKYEQGWTPKVTDSMDGLKIMKEKKYGPTLMRSESPGRCFRASSPHGRGSLTRDGHQPQVLTAHGQVSPRGKAPYATGEEDGVTYGRVGKYYVDGGKFYHVHGSKDDELVGRSPERVGPGYKRAGGRGSTVRWASRVEVDKFNDTFQQIKNQKKNNMIVPSASEFSYEPSNMRAIGDTWGPLTGKVNETGWGKTWDTTFDARRGRPSSPSREQVNCRSPQSKKELASHNLRSQYT